MAHKMVCFLLRDGVGDSVMKNCEVLLFGPLLAEASTPAPTNFKSGWILTLSQRAMDAQTHSSSNGRPCQGEHNCEPTKTDPDTLTTPPRPRRIASLAARRQHCALQHLLIVHNEPRDLRLVRAVSGIASNCQTVELSITEEAAIGQRRKVLARLRRMTEQRELVGG